MRDTDTGRRRVAIEQITPLVDCGRWAVKRIQGEQITVEADIFADGHEQVRGALLFRHEPDEHWSQAALEPLDNDRWRGEFTASELGVYRYTFCGWIDKFGTWRSDFEKRLAANSDLPVALAIGGRLVAAAADRANATDANDAARLNEFAAELTSGQDPTVRGRLALDPALAALVAKYPDLRFATTHQPELRVIVERPLARCGAWYEMFPRSASATPGRHGTFADCVARLPYIAQMGFDVLYLPPIHPIGRTHRKGKNNAPQAQPGEVGSPWGIGSSEGGHKAILADLGTLADFRKLREAAAAQKIEIALDIAYQCSPDHPYVAEHPEWFRRRPDGTIQYAENPPKKYEDIFPLDFETDAWRPLWEELKSVMLYWAGEGVRIFRVDNPHTKPFPFWEWLIDDVRRRYPDVLLLAEAFTRPKVMFELAKLGFTQSYTYFTWRNTRQELTEYFQELSRPELREVFRANLFANTPDILHEYLQTGGRGAFVVRLILAATLGASYGIYGPAYELCENQPIAPGSEEYLNSEKYELRHWQLDRPDNLAPLVGQINRIRRENRALQSDANLEFHKAENDGQQLLCYSKRSDDGANIIVAVVNLDPRRKQSGMVELPLARWGIPLDRPIQMHDLLTDKRWTWKNGRSFVELDPQVAAAHIFRLRRWVRAHGDSEQFE